MYSFELDANILRNHKLFATPATSRSKYERERQRIFECALLTNIAPNILQYTTIGPSKAIQSQQTVSFQLPCPLAINLYSVNNINKTTTAHIEIPECTLETAKMFYNKDRPRFIHETDLATSVISVNGAHANIQYVKTKPFEKFDDIVYELTQNPATNWRQYEWIARDDDNLFEYWELEKIYQAVFHTHYPIPRKYMSAPRNEDVMTFLEKVMMAATKIGTLDKKIYNPDNNKVDVYKMPVAMFQDKQQQVIWLAKKSERVK